MSHGVKRDDIKHIAAALLAAGGRLVEVAEKAGVSDRQLKRWRAEDDDFRALVELYRAAVVEEVLDGAAKHLQPAICALERNLACGQPAQEVRAAVEMINAFLKLREQGSIADRLAALEAALAAEGKE